MKKVFNWFASQLSVELVKQGCQTFFVDEINAEFIERYQQIFAKDPRSKVFAPLAEAYRKLGLLSQAEQVCKRGVNFHPNFVSGQVAYAKILIDQKRWADAVVHLEIATRLSPDNLLAHKLLGKSYLQQRNVKFALQSYKMVLFLNPRDEEAMNYVKKWESLTADEYGVDLFELSHTLEQKITEKDGQLDSEGFHSSLSMIDAYIVRNQFEKAYQLLKNAAQFQPHPEIDKRLKLLARYTEKLNPLNNPLNNSVNNPLSQSITSPTNLPITPQSTSSISTLAQEMLSVHARESSELKNQLDKKKKRTDFLYKKKQTLEGLLQRIIDDSEVDADLNFLK